MKRNILAYAALLGSYYLPAQNIMWIENGAEINIQNGATLNIAGGITLADGSQLINNGTIILEKLDDSQLADWLDNTTTPYNYGQGTLTLTSNSIQTLNSKNIFGNITVNTGQINFASDIISNNWLLIKGPVSTGSFKAIALSSSQFSVAADASNANFVNSWFNGTLRRFITPFTVNNYLFPVGNATECNQAILDNLTTDVLNNLNYVDVSFGPKPGTDDGLLVSDFGTPYTSVNNGGVWFLTTDIIPTSGKFDLLLYFNDFEGLGDNEFAILGRPISSGNAVDWSIPPGSVLPDPGTPGRLIFSGYARQNNLSGFNQFGIGITITPIINTVTGPADTRQTLSPTNENSQPVISVKLFPNPSQSQFSIRIEGTSNIYNASISDMNGRTIKSFSVSGNTNIPVTGLSGGNYTIRVENVYGKNKSFIEKILIIP